MLGLAPSQGSSEGLEVRVQGAVRTRRIQTRALVKDSGPYKHRLSGFSHPRPPWLLTLIAMAISLLAATEEPRALVRPLSYLMVVKDSV